MAKLNIPVIDYSGEASAASLPVADTIADLTITALFGAVDGIVIGNLAQSTLNISTKKDAGRGGSATNNVAQREMKWLCRYHDAKNLDKYTLEVPCADAALLTGNTDFMDLAAGAGQQFKTDFDASCEAPRTGNAVVLDSVQLVGRNI